MSVLESQVFTGELTNDTLTITESMGVKRVSVFNGSAVTGTVLGNRNLGGLAPTTIDIVQGDSFTVDAPDASVIKSLVINAPAGCTLKIVAQ